MLDQGKISLVHAFNRCGISVNGHTYLERLQYRVWPLFRSSTTQRNLLWMQNEAPPHSSKVAKYFLKEKFWGRVIGRGNEFVWPALSPGLNPVDFHFWAVAQEQVYLKLQLLVYWRIFIVKRAMMCLHANGEHFRHCF